MREREPRRATPRIEFNSKVIPNIPIDIQSNSAIAHPNHVSRVHTTWPTLTFLSRCFPRVADTHPHSIHSLRGPFDNLSSFGDTLPSGDIIYKSKILPHTRFVGRVCLFFAGIGGASLTVPDSLSPPVFLRCRELHIIEW